MIEELQVFDFSGGEVDARSVHEPSDRQALALRGLVLEGDRELRAQWGGVTASGTLTGVADLGLVDGLLVARDGGGVWHTAPQPAGTAAPVWAALEDLPAGVSDLSIVGRMAVRAENAWVNALLLNSATATSAAVAVYQVPSTGAAGVKSWTERHPSGTPTANAMPRGAVAAMWGDFLVLGDIAWNLDDTQPLTESNSTRFPHGLWYSQPGKLESWDPIDVEFMGQKAGDNRVLGLFPVEQGMVVVTAASVVMLRGTPTTHSYEELRTGVSPATSDAVAFWPATGTVCWLDEFGRVWHTNGDEFARLDRPIDVTVTLAARGSVTAAGDYLLVSGSDEVHVFRAFAEDGAWTRLVSSDGWAAGSLHGEDLWARTVGGAVHRYRMGDGTIRGSFDGVPVRSLLRTRPLSEGHATTFWHRVAVRALGPGQLARVVSRPSAEVGGPVWVAGDDGYSLAVQRDWVFPAHGASLDMTVDVEFDGDVTVESVSAWFHKGRAKR